MLTLLIPNYERPKELGRLLGSIIRAVNCARAQKWIKICVVDDYSHSDISCVVKEYMALDFFSFHLQSTKCGNAETAAMNALEFVETEYVWLLGNDDEISADSLVYLEPLLFVRKYGFILLNPCLRNQDGMLSLPISATEELLEYEKVTDLFDDFGFVTSTTTFSCQLFRTEPVRTFHFAEKLCSISSVYSHTFTFFSALKDYGGLFVSRPIVKFTQNAALEELYKLRRQAPNKMEFYHQTSGLLKLVKTTSQLTSTKVEWLMSVSEDEIDKQTSEAHGTKLGLFMLHFVVSQMCVDLRKFGRVKHYAPAEIDAYYVLFRGAEVDAEESFASVMSIIRSQNIPAEKKEGYLHEIMTFQRERARTLHALQPRAKRDAPKLKLYTSGRMRSFSTHAR